MDYIGANLRPSEIPMDKCKDGYLYKVDCRNARVGIYNAERKGFIIRRTKFGNTFIDMEFHYDTGAPHGTAFPLEEMEKAPDFGPVQQLLNTLNPDVLDYLGKKTEESIVYYACQEDGCERGKKLDEVFLVSFKNSEGKTIYKCPYCRGRMKRI